MSPPVEARCGADARQRLLDALPSTPPEGRAAVLEAFIERCGEDPALARLLEAAQPITVQLPPREITSPSATPTLTVVLGPGGVELDGVVIAGSAGEGWEEAVRGALQARMAGFAGAKPELRIAADASVPYVRLVTLMDLAREAGIERFSFMVQGGP